MRVLVAGATGKTGCRIVEQLVQKGVEVRALVRDRTKAQTMLPGGVEIVVGDVLEPQTLDAALQNVQVVQCATGATPSLDPTGPYKVDYEGTRNLIDASKRAGIEHFVLVSSLCVSKLFHPLNLFWGVLYWKQQAEDTLKASGLTYTIVRPGGLREESNAEPVVMSPADTLFEGSIPREKVAQVCVEAATQPEAKNKVVEIVTSPSASSQPMAALFAGVN